jgi:uncharacterized BrkB/YihY/UPF0761 family membrane protein
VNKRKSAKGLEGSETWLDRLLAALFLLGAVLVIAATMLLQAPGVHGLILAMLVFGALIGATASLTYGIRYSSIRLSLGMSLGYLLAAAWELIPPETKPSWSGLVPAALLALALIPWLILVRRAGRGQAVGRS